MGIPYQTQKGFTIVELLIVIVVIGILAAIVIVAYNGIQSRAKDSAIKSDIENFSKKIELAKVDNAGVYPNPGSLTASMGIEVNKSLYPTNSNNWYYCIDSTGSRYSLGVATDTARNGYVYDSVSGLSTVGTSPGLYGAAACPSAIYTSTPNMAQGCTLSGSTCGWAAWVN